MERRQRLTWRRWNTCWRRSTIARDIILRDHFRKSLAAFDQQRLARWPYDRAKPLLRPMFISGAQLADLSQTNPSSASASTPTVHNLAGGIRWMIAVQWQPGVLSPVGSGRWIGMEQTPGGIEGNGAHERRNRSRQPRVLRYHAIWRRRTRRRRQARHQPGRGDLSEFLAAVRKQWQISGDLALLIATPNYIQFVEADNTRLLDVVHPGFKGASQSTENARAQRRCGWAMRVSWPSSTTRPRWSHPPRHSRRGARSRARRVGRAGRTSSTESEK